MAEAGVAGVLEIGGDVRGGNAGGGDRIGIGGPDGGDPDSVGELVPLVSEVEVEELFAGASFAGVAVLEGKERGVADEECGVGDLEHGLEVGGVLDEGGLNLPEAREEDARVGGRGDGAAGDDSERGGEGEGGDGDEADVGGARGEFSGAFGGRVGGELVAFGEAGAIGLVLEAPH